MNSWQFYHILVERKHNQSNQDKVRHNQRLHESYQQLIHEESCVPPFNVCSTNKTALLLTEQDTFEKDPSR